MVAFDQMIVPTLPHRGLLPNEGSIQVGPWVVQEDRGSGLVLGEPVPEFDIIDAYRVEDGKIVKCIGFQ